jgi:flagellar hook-associated protein 1 FlgK
VVQSSQGGGSSQLTLANAGAGTVLTRLGMPTTTATGRDTAIRVEVEGSYTGATNDRFTFVPESDGVIGQTRNLRVRVLDSAGQLVTTLAVGDNYEPGQPLDLGNGIKVKLGAGSISASAGNTFAVDGLADSDTSDLLVATGTNVFFLGSNASDITVNPELSSNPDRLAAGLGAASGDSGNLMRMGALRQRKLDSLDANTIEDFYADIVGDVGFQAAAANSTLASQQTLLSQLQNDRDSVSGVNIDEEMLDMQKYQQSYQAAARFLSVAQQMTDTLINLGR